MLTQKRKINTLYLFKNMKKVSIFFLLLAALCFSLVSCTDKEDDPGVTDEKGDFGTNPRSEVPDELVGYWLTGSTSIGSFWNYDGSYAGAAYEIAVGYKFYKNGNAKQYFYYTNTSYSCRSQILGYREGTVVFDTKNKTFEFFAASGNYRSYNSCQSQGNGQTKQYGAGDLYPAKKAQYDNWSLVQENGKSVWRIKLSDGSNLNYEKSTEPQQ